MSWSAVAFGQVTGTTGAAAPSIDSDAALGLEAAIVRAVSQEPSLRAVRADIEMARGLRLQAELRPNPTVRVEQREEPGGTDRLTTVGLEWPLDLYRRPGRVHTADHMLVQSQFAADDVRRVLVADVRLRYGAAAAAIRELAVAEELLTAARRQLDVVRARVEAGGTPPLERDLLEVEVRRLDAARLLAMGRADAALVQLKPLLGMAPGEALRLRDSLDALVASTATDPMDVAPRPPDARPDVREAAARVAVADARIDQARREGRVDVSLFANYMRMDMGFAQRGFGQGGSLERVRGRFTYFSAGAAVSIPVLNRNQGQIAAARAERVSAEARLDATELAARAEMATALARESAARQAFAVYSGGVRGLARQNLDVVRQTFDLGRATVFDVLAEQRRFLEVEQGYIASARELWDARVELTRAMGETQ
ncbi:MAG: TolC family protein [Acidobacteria bacterium]|nr:TolC family protein [Acidobacteriota bacterium]